VTGAAASRVRVLVVDDSAAIRSLLQRALARDAALEVVGTAPDAPTARQRIAALAPDVVTLDLEMPHGDGLTFLRALMVERPTPVVVVSSTTPGGGARGPTSPAAGAVDVLCKPSAAGEVGPMLQRLIATVKAAARVRAAPAAPRPRAGTLPQAPRLAAAPSHAVIAIGASTGGTVAIERILATLPADHPGIVVTQHLPEAFTPFFARHLRDSTHLDVREARAGDVVETGVVLVAPGDRHLVLRRSGAAVTADLDGGPKVNHHRPSVDVMFRSAARAAGARTIGVLLTGMGSDGAEGLRELRGAGARTIAQDEESSVVYGMPRAAVELGAAAAVLPLGGIAGEILRAASRIGCTN